MESVRCETNWSRMGGRYTHYWTMLVLSSLTCSKVRGHDGCSAEDDARFEHLHFVFVKIMIMFTKLGDSAGVMWERCKGVNV